MKIFNIIITTKKKQDDLIIGCMQRLERVDRISVWAAINPVIYSLKELREDTWNQDKITKIQEWLKNNFCIDN